MTEMRRRSRLCAGILMASGMCPSLLPAATVVTVKVTVMEALPCVINNNQVIEVDFGNVMTNQVDGNNYEQILDYSLSCTGNTSNAMTMQIRGTQAGSNFGSNVLQSNVPGLGIALKKAGSALELNNWSTFTYPTLPVLSAVPVKAAGSILSGGEFSASATMRVEYQ